MAISARSVGLERKKRLLRHVDSIRASNTGPNSELCEMMDRLNKRGFLEDDSLLYTMRDLLENCKMLWDMAVIGLPPDKIPQLRN